MMRFSFTTALSMLASGALAQQEPIAFDMVKSSSKNLIAFTNVWKDAFLDPDDAFQKFERGVDDFIPFVLLDDTLRIFPSDDQGMVKEGNCDEFFGVTDTINGDNSGTVAAEWSFDISDGGDVPLELCINMAAMGDFESSDSFEWTYSIDNGPEFLAFQSSVNEAGFNNYVLDSGKVVTLPDPIVVDGQVVTNEFKTFCTEVSGVGSTMSLALEAVTNGNEEAFAFQKITITPSCQTCGVNNPCTPENIAARKFYHPHCDPNIFIQCDQVGRCFEKSCPAGLVFDPEANVCNFP